MLGIIRVIYFPMLKFFSIYAATMSCDLPRLPKEAIDLLLVVCAPNNDCGV
ncbi:hypothetical protein EPIB2_142 [Tritonibacter mobilis]|nr:hypothetical protein EPIB2_142 [Tritonibacter mobilis]